MTAMEMAANTEEEEEEEEREEVETTWSDFNFTNSLRKDGEFKM